MGNQSEISSEAFSARELPKKRSRSRSVLIVGQGTESWLLIVPAHSTPRDAADAATTTSIPVVTPSLARPRVDARPASSASSAEGGDQRDTCANKRSLPHYSDELNNEFSRSKRSSDASIGMTFASACTASDVVGHRITVDAADVLVIAAADASERDLVARAERASVHLRKLRPNDLVTVVEQPSRPRTFVPPGYGLPLTQEVAAKMGATVHSMTRDASQLASHDGGAKARGRQSNAALDTIPLSQLMGATAADAAARRVGRPAGKKRGRGGGGALEGGAGGGGGVSSPHPRRARYEPYLPFTFDAEELKDLAIALRAFLKLQESTGTPVTSWSNLVARRWSREYALSLQALGWKCTAQKVKAAVEENLLNRYEATSSWGWKGGWPREAVGGGVQE